MSIVCESWRPSFVVQPMCAKYSSRRKVKAPSV